MKSSEHEFNWTIFKFFHQISQFFKCLVINDLGISETQYQVWSLCKIWSKAMSLSNWSDFLEILWVIQIRDSSYKTIQNVSFILQLSRNIVFNFLDCSHEFVHVLIIFKRQFFHNLSERRWLSLPFNVDSFNDQLSWRGFQ